MKMRVEEKKNLMFFNLKEQFKTFFFFLQNNYLRINDKISLLLIPFYLY